MVRLFFLVCLKLHFLELSAFHNFLCTVMARFTLSIVAFLILTGLSTFVHAAVLIGRASGTSSYVAVTSFCFQHTDHRCSCFACPSEDEAAFPLGNNDDTGGVFFCSYPAFAGENPNDFYCTYNDVCSTFSLLDLLIDLQIQSNGNLITDNDAGFCPATALSTCARKRDDNFKAMKRRAEARAAQPQSSRSNPLRKKKRAD